MASHQRSHSIASSTGSLSDDLNLAFTSSNTPSTADPFSSYSYGAAGGAGDTSLSELGLGESPYLGGHSRRSSVALGVTSPGLGGGETAPSTTGGEGSRRSRARAFSFLSTHQSNYGPREGDTAPFPSTGETPFAGGAYDFALDAGDDSLSSDGEGEGVEMQQAGVAGSASPRTREGRAYRTRFQPLLGVELAWMGVSAAAVTALTVGAVVLAFAG
jgi:hypothetical protein